MVCFADFKEDYICGIYSKINKNSNKGKTHFPFEKRKQKLDYLLIDNELCQRGIKKEEANIDEWLKDIAPSDGLRKWFPHDSGKGDRFKKKYLGELSMKKDLCEKNIDKGEIDINLLYAAKDAAHNNVIVLREFLEDNY